MLTGCLPHVVDAACRPRRPLAIGGRHASGTRLDAVGMATVPFAACCPIVDGCVNHASPRAHKHRACVLVSLWALGTGHRPLPTARQCRRFCPLDSPVVSRCKSRSYSRLNRCRLHGSRSGSSWRSSQNAPTIHHAGGHPGPAVQVF